MLFNLESSRSMQLPGPPSCFEGGGRTVGKSYPKEMVTTSNRLHQLVDISWSSEVRPAFHKMLWKWPGPADCTFKIWVTESDSELGRILPPGNLAKNNTVTSNLIQNKMAVMKMNNLCQDENLIWIDDFLKWNGYFSNAVFFSVVIVWVHHPPIL